MWVKICGIKEIRSAEEVIRFQPDAIGLNFFERSKRYVTPDVAKEIVRILPETICPVGLFVNHSLEQIRSIATTCGIRTIQLHGDETPDFVAELRDFQIIRACRVGEEGLDTLQRELEEHQKRGTEIKSVLIDAKVEGSYGGTGHVAPWELLSQNWCPDWPPMVLAGGLHPENVREAISTVRPFGVDVASGVEEFPGKQSPEAVRRFIEFSRQPVINTM
ncbi:phosphoribosylanthranilate isomerase [Planctomicrobium sp. SH668]|uniref:phosphoribosylanthranilate isomerase n=1 Tax=Planctomicrobium sp. SH668 TaxID=3448126 RepID=UPI003F5BC089